MLSYTTLFHIRKCTTSPVNTLFDVNSHGAPDSVKVNHKNFMNGYITEFTHATPDLKRMKMFKTYLTELDRRRNTDFTKLYPQIYQELKDL